MQTGLYWRWVIASSAAALVSAVASYGLNRFATSNGEPLSPWMELADVVVLSLPLALAQAIVLQWTFPRVSRIGYVLLTVVPILLLTLLFLLLVSVNIGTAVPDPEPAAPLPPFPFLESLFQNPLVFLGLSAAVVFAFVTIISISCVIAWLAMRRAVDGLGPWLLWNGLGVGIATILALAILYVMGLNWFNDVETSSHAALYGQIAGFMFVVVSSVFAGIGVAQLRAKDELA
jgi:hypothetical protein